MNCATNTLAMGIRASGHCTCSTSLGSSFKASTGLKALPSRQSTFCGQTSPVCEVPTRRGQRIQRGGACLVVSSAEPAAELPAARTAMGRAPGRSLVVTRTAEVAQSLEAPTASLSRVIYSTVQPTRIARTAGAGSGRHGSPIASIIPSILVLALTVGTAAVAAMRAKLRAVRECKTCHGYGVQRCKLCSGKGTIEWEGKMAHREPCPMCLGRRMNPCTCCGGGPLMARHLFAHKQRTDVDFPVALPTGSNARLGGLLLRLGRSNGAEEENRIKQSDQFKEQIMMD